MSIITNATGLVNFALGLYGGAGNQVSASGQLSDLNGTDKVTSYANTYLPFARQQAIKDLARAGLPFRETFKYADLGDDLKEDDVSIDTLSGDGATVTVVTQTVHGHSTGDTVFLQDIEGTGYIALNGTTQTITVTDTTTFTFTSTVTGTYTDNSGIVSKCPEIASWMYAFDLPSDFLEIVGQYDESSVPSRTNFKSQYQTATMLNKDDDGYLLLTNNISNLGGDSAYIGYVIDFTTYTMWSMQLVKCAAYLLAELMCPVCGRDSKFAYFMRQQYIKEILPMAKRMNAVTFNDKPTVNIDYSGGRKSNAIVTRQTRDLGTYVDGDGVRRDVY